MIIGYARVSTDDQNLDMQLDALDAAGCERVFKEHASGKNTERPELQSMLNMLRKGDTVVVYKLDRISRSVQDLESLAKMFDDMGVEFVSVVDQIDTTTAMGRFFFHVMAAISELERSIIVERTAAGLRSARARGRVGGRPALDEATIKRMLKYYDSKTMSVSEICEAVGVSKPTLYKYVNKRKSEEESPGSE